QAATSVPPQSVDVGGLHAQMSAAAVRHATRTAVVDPGVGAISYAKLDALSDRLRDVLIARGIRRGDRVGVYITKSIDAVAAIFGILKAGAAYVPIDPHGPVGRNAYILNDCAVSLVVIEHRLVDATTAELTRLGSSPSLITVAAPSDGAALEQALGVDAKDREAARASTVRADLDDLAYIL